MKIKELVLDAIINTKLFEMARSRDDALRLLTSLQFQIGLHILKILMYGKTQDYKHWVNEINTWLNDVQSIYLKPSKKRLGADVYKKYLWEHLFESVSEVQNHMNRLYREYPNSTIIQPDAILIHKELLEILNKICDDVSQNKFATITNYIKGN